jgi:hypothetical protein
MNRFIKSLAIVSTLSYRNYKIAINITHKQFTLSKYKTAWNGVSNTQ